MERRYQQGAIEVRTDGEGEAQSIEGMGAVFFRADDPGTEFPLWDGAVERIKPSAFDRALQDGDDARALFNHDPNNLLGRRSNGTLTIEKTKRGLKYSIPVDKGDADHQRVLAKIERGDLTGSSFSFNVLSESWTRDGDREIREINSVELYDVGPVTFPAYSGTSVGMRSADHLEEAQASYDAWKATQTDDLQGFRDRVRVAEAG